MRIAVLGSGRGSNLEAILRHIGAGHVEAEVAVVASDRRDARILGLAAAHGVPAHHVPRTPRRDDYDGALLDVLAPYAPDLVVLAGFMRILGDRFVASYPQRIVNIHPSLLPAFPGAHGIRDAWNAGARIVGCTTHIVDGTLDGGPIILQAALAVRHDEDERGLAQRVLRVEHLVLPRTIQLFCEGRVHVTGGRVAIAAGPSWLQSGPDPVAGVVYGEGY